MMAESRTLDPARVLLDSLSRLRREVEGVIGSTVCDHRGLTVVSDDPGKRAEVLSATGALIRSSTGSAFRTLGFDEPQAIVVDGVDVQAYVCGVPTTRFTLIVLMEKDINLGLFLLRVRELQKELASFLEAYA
jgi:predicted regulator of Ras-like GTPase activity (Roadblock/LC7/MglB family)